MPRKFKKVKKPEKINIKVRRTKKSSKKDWNYKHVIKNPGRKKLNTLIDAYNKEPSYKRGKFKKGVFIKVTTKKGGVLTLLSEPDMVVNKKNVKKLLEKIPRKLKTSKSDNLQNTGIDEIEIYYF
jgi:hypothetical protein